MRKSGSKISGADIFLSIRVLFSVLLCLSLCSCATSGAPPIQSREAPPSRKINVHEVQQGESLYSIAWRYETDFRDMARINGLREPYALSRGQQLKIYDDGTSVPVVSSRSSASSSSSGTARAVPVIRGSVSTSDETGSYPSSSNSSSNPLFLPAEISQWVWPVKGRVTSAFGSDSRTKGIVIDPGSATDVGSAGDGVVVYAGTGIRGVGNLIIVKHSELYLSAYAYNSQLLAKEGDQVRAGQSIAKVGKNTDGSPRVYFEIRKDGKPVDPIGYLPAR